MIQRDASAGLSESTHGATAVAGVCVIGASAGGLEALELFFASVPERTGVAWVVVQHLSPDHKSLMAELLARHTRLPVTRAEDGQPLRPDTIFLNPPKTDLTFEGTTLRVRPHTPLGLHLEAEIQHVREHLQATVEELETSNEELQATNEELLASNEELQSTNEELQSVNEELQTVNAEHQEKIQELTEMTNDIENLLRTTGVAMLFLDADARIGRFTSGATMLLNLMPQDVGRPIAHLTSRASGLDVESLARRVQETRRSERLDLTMADGTM